MKLYEALRMEAKDKAQREGDRAFAWQMCRLVSFVGLGWMLLVLLGVM